MRTVEQDRRVRRTRRLLHQALIDLILERGYDKTTVSDILDRADVGRSTFYTHFRDKDELLVAGFDELQTQFELHAVDHGRPAGDAHCPALALFTHAAEYHQLYRALCGRRGGDVAQRHLHRMVTELLRAHLP